MNMCRKLFTVVVVAALCAAARAAEPTAPQTPAKTTTSPVAKSLPKAAAVIDLCKDVVDPFNPAEERYRFFLAAGVDNELTGGEFEANRTKDKPFVRKFDTWRALVGFDKSGNGTIDWFEAEAYRWDLRKRILAAFDENKDGRLAGKERDAANRALAAGKIPPPVEKTDGPRQPVVFFGPPTAGRGGRTRRHVIAREEAAGTETPVATRQLTRAERVKKYDTDGDGKLSRQERSTMYQAMAEQRRKRWLARYDKDGDGKVSEAEREAVMEDYRRRVAEATRRWELRRYDANKDGQIDPKEREKIEKDRAERQERFQRMREEMEKRRRELVKKYDADGNGSLSDTERKKMGEDFRRQAEAARKKWTEQRDADGDGKVSAEERRQYREKLNKKYDADGDGKLNNEERAKMVKEEYGSSYPYVGGWGSGQ